LPEWNAGLVSPIGFVSSECVPENSQSLPETAIEPSLPLNSSANTHKSVTTAAIAAARFSSRMGGVFVNRNAASAGRDRK